MVKKAKVKKRGVKPGTKRGSYRTKKQIEDRITILSANQAKAAGWRVLENFDPGPAVGPMPILSLCESLEETITRFENRVSNSIARLNSLIGQV